MRPPNRWLAPGAGTAMPPPPPAVRRRRQGTRGPPPHPPPSHSGPRAGRGRPKKRRPRTPPEEAAAPGVRGHHGRGRRPHTLPSAGRRRTGGAQDGANGAALSEAGPGNTGALTRAGGFPPPPPPPPPHWPVGGRPDRARRPRPPGNPHGTSIPRGGTPETTDGRPTPDGAGGRGGGPPSPPPPPPPPPSLGATGAALRPPGAEGTPPAPEGTATRRGGCGWTCKLRAPAPPAACSPRGRGRRVSPHQRAGATRAPSLGAAHGGAPEQYGGRALHDPPVTTAHSGRAEGGFRSAGAPRGAVHGPPLTPPHPGAAPRPRPHAHAGVECADDTRGARIEYRRPRPRRGAGRPRRDPSPPTPPTGPQAAGAPAPTPRGRGDGPPPRPREEPERGPPPRPSRRLPQGPRRTSGPAPTRQDAAQIAPREGGRARTGMVWGITPPMDSTTPATPALLPSQGRQRDGTRQSDPPPYRPPPASQTGGTAHAPPPPPQPAPRHTNATDPPRGAQPPQGVQAEGTEKGPHTRTPAPRTRG